jgi:hypothetical protein
MSAMIPTTRVCAILLPLLLVGGCIVGDQLTTITVHPDGSADLVEFRSNLHSTEKGDKAEKELADYKASIDTRADGDPARIREAGGEAVEATWVRQQAPFSTLVRAHFPSPSALEKYGTVKDEHGGFQMTTQFRSDGVRRSLTVGITVPPEKANPSQSSPSDVGQFRQTQADGISETRIAVTKGSITTARGFTVASDKQSALLDASAIDEILRTGGKAELYLEWDVTP